MRAKEIYILLITSILKEQLYLVTTSVRSLRTNKRPVKERPANRFFYFKTYNFRQNI